MKLSDLVGKLVKFTWSPMPERTQFEPNGFVIEVTEASEVDGVPHVAGRAVANHGPHRSMHNVRLGTDFVHVLALSGQTRMVQWQSEVVSVL